MKAHDIDAEIARQRARITAWRAHLAEERSAAKAEAERRQFWATVDAKRTPVLTFKERAK